MMPWGWERRNKDAARVVGLICSSAAAAGPGYEPKGASESRLASQTAAHRPETSGHTPTAVFFSILRMMATSSQVPEGEHPLASRPQRGRSVCSIGSTNTEQLGPLVCLSKSPDPARPWTGEKSLQHTADPGEADHLIRTTEVVLLYCPDCTDSPRDRRFLCSKQ